MKIKNLSKNFFINLSFILLIFLFDRISKIYVIYLDNKLLGSEIFSSNFLNIYLIWNEGIAFGLFSFNEKIFYNILTIIILIIIICLFSLSANAIEKKTTFDKDLFDKAQSDGKIVIVSSWVKYCMSCAGQMKILKQAKETGALSDINFDNIEYFSFDITNKEIADLLNVKFQTTLLIFENNKEIYRSLGETTKELIYDAIKSSI